MQNGSDIPTPTLTPADPPAAIVSPPSDFPNDVCGNEAPSAPSAVSYDPAQQPVSISCDNDDSSHLQDTTCTDSKPVSSPLRISSRQRKPPAWQQGDTWILD